MIGLLCGLVYFMATKKKKKKVTTLTMMRFDDGWILEKVERVVLVVVYDSENLWEKQRKRVSSGVVVRMVKWVG